MFPKGNAEPKSLVYTSNNIFHNSDLSCSFVNPTNKSSIWKISFSVNAKLFLFSYLFINLGDEGVLNHFSKLA